MSNQYLILDAARCGMNAVEQAAAFSTMPPAILFGLSEKEDYMAVVAPYLFTLNAGLKEWYANHGWNNAWGCIIVAAGDHDVLAGHFRKLAIKIAANGGELYFRFYDPRTIKVFLPAYDKTQVAAFFGPVEKFIVEGDPGGMPIVFSHQEGSLQQNKIAVADLFDKPLNTGQLQNSGSQVLITGG